MKKNAKEAVEMSINGKKIDPNKLEKLISDKPLDIMGAELKDGFCNYEVKILKGQMTGETSKIKGPLIVAQDLRDSFTRLAIHLAIIDMAFKHSGFDVTSIEGVRGHELEHDYDVSGIKIKGADENIQVSIIGTKYLTTCTGRMACATPFILLDAGTEYKWYNELLEDVENVRREVIAYKGGKGQMPEISVKKSKVKQMKITDKDQIEVGSEEEQMSNSEG